MAIIEAHGWDAVFRYQGTTATGTREPYEGTQHVVLWQVDEQQRVVGLVENKGRLRSAESFDNFLHYMKREDQYGAAFAAPSGWWEVRQDTIPEDGPGEGDPQRAYWWRIVAWRVDDCGYGLQAMSSPGADGSADWSDPGERTQFIFDPDRRFEGVGPWPKLRWD